MVPLIYKKQSNNRQTRDSHGDKHGRQVSKSVHLQQCLSRIAPATRSAASTGCQDCAGQCCCKPVLCEVSSTLLSCFMARYKDDRDSNFVVHLYANAFKQVHDNLAIQKKRVNEKPSYHTGLLRKLWIILYVVFDRPATWQAVYLVCKCIQAGTGQTLYTVFWQASYMASCGSMHLVDHASEGPGHCGGPLPRLGPTSARSLPPAPQESSQTHTWQSMVRSHMQRGNVRGLQVQHACWLCYSVVLLRIV